MISNFDCLQVCRKLVRQKHRNRYTKQILILLFYHCLTERSILQISKNDIRKYYIIKHTKSRAI